MPRTPRILYALALLLCLSWATTADAATLSFSNAAGVVGRTVSVSVLVSAQDGESLNGVSARIQYPTDKLTLISMSKAGSVISFWAEEPSFSNSSGTASVDGIVPNPGFSGQGGRVITLVFEVRAPGTASLSFGNASVLANDGRGTNILTNAYSRSLALSAAPASTPTPTPAPEPQKPATPAKPRPSPTVPAPESEATTTATTATSSSPSVATNIFYDPPANAAVRVGRWLTLALAAIGLMALVLAGFLIALRLLERAGRRRLLVHRSFGLLKKDLVTHIKELRKTEGVLSKKETAFLEQFEQDLAEVESLVESKRLPKP